MQKHHIGVKYSLAPLLPSFTPSVFLPLHPSEEIITMINTKALQVAGSKWEVSCLRYTHKFRQMEVVGGCKIIEPERRNRGNICGVGGGNNMLRKWRCGILTSRLVDVVTWSDVRLQRGWQPIITAASAVRQLSQLSEWKLFEGFFFPLLSRVYNPHLKGCGCTFKCASWSPRLCFPRPHLLA